MLLFALTLTLILTLGLGFWVFASAPGQAENRAFAGFMWLSSLWVLNDLGFWCLEASTPDTWGRVAFAVGLGLQLSFLWFAWVFPRARPLPRAPTAGVAALTAVAVGLIAFGQPVDVRGDAAALELTMTPTTYALGAFVYGLFFLGRAIVVGRLREAGDGEEARRHLRAVLVAPAVTGVLASLAIVVLPLFGVFDALPYAGLAILVGSSLHARALLRERLLRPRSVLDGARAVPVTAKLALTMVGCWLASVALVLLAARLTFGPLSAAAWGRAAALSVVLTALPTMLLILLVQRLVAAPLRAISEAAHAVTQGDTSVRVATTTQGLPDDEVALLARSFNAMVDRLEADLLAERETAEALQRSERLAVAGSLAAGVAHEVNNPLAAISSLVQTARDLSAGETADLLTDALAQIERITAALNDMTHLARPPSAERRPLDLRQIVADTLRLLRYDKRFRRVALTTELPEAPLTVTADPARLQQVLLNLLLNARDAVAEVDPPRVVVAARAEREAVLEVRDGGPGVPPEARERVFEPFHTTKPSGAGTGLGLAVCRDIARVHGGSLRVDEAPEGGARFALRLPREASEDAPAPAPAEEAAA